MKPAGTGQKGIGKLKLAGGDLAAIAKNGPNGILGGVNRPVMEREIAIKITQTLGQLLFNQTHL